MTHHVPAFVRKSSLIFAVALLLTLIPRPAFAEEIVRPGTPGPTLKEGMVFAVEPMVNVGGVETYLRDDGWSVMTADGSLSAHFEHTIAVTDDGPEVFTAA